MRSILEPYILNEDSWVCFLESRHGLCTHLSSYMDKESTLVADFSACMYQHGHQEEFEEAFENLRAQVPAQTWFGSIYKVKEKWEKCFMINAFTLGM